MIISLSDQTLSAYRNGIRIAYSSISSGGHAFTMLVAEEPSAFVPNRPAHRWMAVRTQGKATLEDIARRVRISPEFAEKVCDIVFA